GFRSLLLIAPSGDVIVWEPPGPVPNLKNRDYFQNPMATRQTYITGVARTRRRSDQYEPLVVISLPVLDSNGNAKAVLAGSLDLRNFKNFGRDYATIRSASIVILDQADKVIYSNSYLFSPVDSLQKTQLVTSARQA